jgi:hypothetical protein
MAEKVSILIVNGGKDPKNGKWIELCIDKILEHTEWQNYTIYIWNNNVEDNFVSDFLKGIPIVKLVQADACEKLAHVHAVPLQRLYELACQEDKPKFIVTMDSDAHPMQKGWLTQLISSLNDEVVLAGVWRDELKKAIPPYIHASCLCTTVDFIEKNNLRLDFIAPKTEIKIHDTLSIFTETVNRMGLQMFKLCRSNKNNFHRLMGGIYGDLIYHHGAGSRAAISFWDEARSKNLMERNKQIGEIATDLLFSHYSEYMNWLQGYRQNENFEAIMAKLQEIDLTREKFSDRPEFSTQSNKIDFSDRVKKLITKISEAVTFK